MTTTGNQREASVLRDDVLLIAEKIISKYNEKINKLETLKNITIENCSLLLSNNIESLLDNLEQESRLIEFINVIDFELSSIITDFTAIFGKKFTEFGEILNSYNNNIFTQINEARNKINMLLSDLNIRKGEIILALDAEMDKIRNDTVGINRIRDIYKKFPEVFEI